MDRSAAKLPWNGLVAPHEAAGRIKCSILMAKRVDEPRSAAAAKRLVVAPREGLDG
jgi:hypothetical protein